MSNFILNTKLIHPSEMSHLTSRRESNNPSHGWKATKQQSSFNQRLRNNVGALQRQVNALQQSRQSTAGFHPLKIYTFPAYLRNVQSADDWRRVKVRGAGGNSTLGTINRPFGSDQAALPDQEAFLQPNCQQVVQPDGTIWNGDVDTWNEILIPDDGDVYYIWMSFCVGTSLTVSTTPILCAGNDSAACYQVYDGTTEVDPWPNFPLPDPYHYVIGACKALDGVLSICQIMYEYPSLPRFGEDYLTTSGVTTGFTRYRGDYNASAYYFWGDSITQTTPDANGNNWLYQWVYFNDPVTTSFPFADGPIINIDPQSNNPDPWKLISKSPIDASYITGAYNAAKYYLRNT